MEPAVLLHVIENFVGEVEIIREGKKYYERPMDGAEYFDFGGPFGESLIATMGHPEVFSLPRVFPDAKNIEVKLGFWPSEYFEDIMMLSERGLALDNEISVNGQMVNRRNFLVGHIIDSLNNEDIKNGMVKPYGLPVSAWVVIVRGLKDGKRIKYKKTTYSQMGPSTGFSLAVGAEMLAQGKIEKKGLMVPEECIEPEAFVEEVATRSRKAGHFYFSKEQITTEEVLFGKEEI